MIHLSYAIAQFFAIMMGAILRTVGGALAIALAVLLAIVALIAGARVLSRHRRRSPPRRP